jgi:exonuclease III
VHLYVTHAHANYADTWSAIHKSTPDEYKFHRVAQMFEMAQFVRATQGDNTLNIVCGDFNSDELSSHKVLTSPNVSISASLANVEDALFIHHGQAVQDRPEQFSTFMRDESFQLHPPQRLDYILYGPTGLQAQNWSLSEANLIRMNAPSPGNKNRGASLGPCWS